MSVKRAIQYKKIYITKSFIHYSVICTTTTTTDTIIIVDIKIIMLMVCAAHYECTILRIEDLAQSKRLHHTFNFNFVFFLFFYNQLNVYIKIIENISTYGKCIKLSYARSKHCNYCINFIDNISSINQGMVFYKYVLVLVYNEVYL